MRISHLDEMVADAECFARDVYAETIPASPEEREKLRNDIEQYEFMYNLQKAVVIGDCAFGRRCIPDRRAA